MKRKIKNDRGKNIFLISAFILSLFFVSSMLSVYGGGWEVNDTLYSLTIKKANTSSIRTYNELGKVKTSQDVDGDINLNNWFNDGDVLNGAPAISIEMSSSYYMASARGGWEDRQSAVVIDSYTIGDETHKTLYQLYEIAFDITIKTQADKYDKRRFVGTTDHFFNSWGYGLYFEAEPVDVNVLADFNIQPWSPVGEDGDWNIVDGWSGILDAHCLKQEYGIIGGTPNPDESEGYQLAGHTIEDLDSVGSRLNMYVDDILSHPRGFDEAEALLGIPARVQVEVGARLGADAVYHTDYLNHWDSCEVHNVYVTYTIGMDVITSLDYELKVSPIGPIDPPDEDNTDFAPRNSFWLELGGLLSGPFVFIIIALVLIIVGFIALKFIGFAVVVAKYRGGRK